jgi:4-amino-4-deoxy-L-arabinose transferase-like glycosyltransferase
MGVPAESTKGIDRRGLLLLVVIAALALILRLGVAQVLGMNAPLEGDAREYADAASSLAAGQGFTLHGVATGRRQPGWPLLLAGWFTMFGSSPAVGRSATCILGALTVLPLAWAAFRVGGRTAAFVAAGGSALYPPLVVYSTQVLSEVPTVFWVAVAVWLLFEGRVRGRWGWYLGSGLAFGMAILTRGLALAFVGAACLALVTESSRAWRPAIARAAILGASAALVLVPWVVRNAVVMGRATLSTQSQSQLWQGAHPGATGLNRIDWPQTKQRFAQLSALGEVGSAEVMGREATEFIRRHPAEFLRLGLIKAWELWKPWAQTMGPAVNLAYALTAGPLLLVGLVSAFRRGRSRFDRVFLFCSLGLFTALHMIYTAIVRYRVPADALLVIYSAALVAELATRRVRRVHPPVP